MGWHPGGVTRTKIRVIGVNFSEFLVRERKFSSRLSGEFELPEFELSGFYCRCRFFTSMTDVLWDVQDTCIVRQLISFRCLSLG